MEIDPLDFEYAIENTHVIIAPAVRIQSFGDTSFQFTLVSELMDEVNQVRIREGQVDAHRPQILTPESCAKLVLQGFGANAEKFAEQLRANPLPITILRYGFEIRKTRVTESIVHEPIDHVLGRVRDLSRERDDSLRAVIRGVDEAWEVCLLKFTLDMVQRSAADNARDLRRGSLGEGSR